MTELKIGDRVKVIDQDITGEIVRMDGVKAVVLDDDRADWMEEDEEGTLIFRMSSLEKMPRTITVTLKDDFDPTLGADIVEAVEDFEQLLQVEFEEQVEEIERLKAKYEWSYLAHKEEE